MAALVAISSYQTLRDESPVTLGERFVTPGPGVVASVSISQYIAPRERRFKLEALQSLFSLRWVLDRSIYSI